MKRQILAITVLALLSVFLFTRPSPQFTIYTSDGAHLISVELADSDEAKRKGLMGRDDLAENTGMVFLYEEGSSPLMWMKGMRISLDILFIGHDLTINHIEKNAPPCGEQEEGKCPRYRSAKPTAFVLELPAGFAESHGIEVGNKVELAL